MDDLLSIFDSLPPSILVLDKSLSHILNHLTKNSFSTFINSAKIKKTSWLPDSLNNSSSSSLTTPPLTNTPDTPIVFLINLLSNENLSKLLLLSNLIHNWKLSTLPHLIVYHPLLDISLHSYISNIGLESQLASFNIWSTQLPSISYSISNNLSIHSLDLSFAFKDLYLNNSPIPLQLLANYLLNLNIENNYNLRITNTFLKGPLSNQFYSIYSRLLNSHILSLPDSKRKIIDDIDDTIFADTNSFYNNSVHLISIDRSNDLLPCVLSQLSYTGIISEFFNLSSPIEPFNLPTESETISNQQKTTSISSLFSNENQISNIIGDLNFSHVGPILNKNAKLLQSQLNKKDNLNNMDEIKLFVNDLSNLNSTKSLISTHTSIADLILSSLNKSPLQYQKPLNIPLLEDIPLSTHSDVLTSYYSRLMDLQHSILNNELNSISILKDLSLIISSYNDDVQLYDIFKILILLSIVKNGINANDFANYLYNDMIFKFNSTKVLPILLNLQKINIIVFNNSSNINLPSFLSLSKNNQQSHIPLSQSTNSTLISSQSITDFNTLSSTLNLLPIHEESSSPSMINNITDYDDADFTYTGYVPILTRLIQSIYTRSFISSPDTDRAIVYGWNNLDLSSLSTSTTQSFLVPQSKKQLFNSIIPPKISELSKISKSTIIIMAIGGITWSEISSIKYILAKNPLTKFKKIIILTTGIINSNQFISSLSNPS